MGDASISWKPRNNKMKKYSFNTNVDMDDDEDDRLKMTTMKLKD